MDAMSLENINKAVEFVRKKYKGCPNCGELGVHIHNVAGIPLVKKLDPSGYSIDDQIISVLPLVCDSCGYVTLFAAKDIIHLE
jgi:ribosomal protein S27AE